MKFQLYRATDGSVRTADLFKLNGRWTVGVRSVDAEPMSTDDAYERYRHLLAENLTPVEERRWRKLLDGCSIDDLAKDERVSRTAIYECIRGKRDRGGMVRKNRWVNAWWKNRQLALLA